MGIAVDGGHLTAADCAAVHAIVEQFLGVVNQRVLLWICLYLKAARGWTLVTGETTMGFTFYC